MRTSPLLRFFLAAGLCAAVMGPALADPAITAAPSAMRRAPSPHSPIVQTVPADAEIDVQNCSGDWCYGSWRNLFGWIPAFAVAQAGPPPGEVGGPPVVVAAPPVVVGVGPGWGFGWGHPYGWGGYYGGWRRW